MQHPAWRLHAYGRFIKSGSAPQFFQRLAMRRPVAPDCSHTASIPPKSCEEPTGLESPNAAGCLVPEARHVPCIPIVVVLLERAARLEVVQVLLEPSTQMVSASECRDMVSNSNCSSPDVLVEIADPLPHGSLLCLKLC